VEELVGLFKEFSKQVDADKKTKNCTTQQDQEARALAEFFELAKNDPRLAASLIGESIYKAISSHPKTSGAFALGIPAIIALLKLEVLLKMKKFLDNKFQAIVLEN
jgi:hypothetical protein